VVVKWGPALGLVLKIHKDLRITANPGEEIDVFAAVLATAVELVLKHGKDKAFETMMRLSMFADVSEKNLLLLIDDISNSFSPITKDKEILSIEPISLPNDLCNYLIEIEINLGVNNDNINNASDLQ